MSYVYPFLLRICKKRGGYVIIHTTFVWQHVMRPGRGNDYLPWLYTRPLQNIGGGAKVCIVLGK